MQTLFAENNLYILLFIIVAIAFTIYQINHQAANLKAIDTFLTDYYNELGLEFLSSSPLKTADKLKYGVPMFSFISLYTSTFKIFSALDEKYYRVVETKEASGKEYIRYVEIILSTKELISINEFDCYEF